jgi:hypothetical protein
MRRLGMRCRKSASMPGKCDPQMQFDFLNEELLPRLEEAKKGERRVFFVDAAHFVDRRVATGVATGLEQPL